MNKKGYDLKELMKWVAAILFFVLFVIILINRLGDDKESRVCKPENCYARADGCPSDKFHISVYKCEDKDAQMCCMSLEEQTKYKESATPGTTTSVVNPSTGNIKILLGVSSTPISGPRTLKAENSYDFKVSVDGALTACVIKIMDADTLNDIKTESWIKVQGSDCKSTSGIIISMTPEAAQVNKAYRMEVTAQNSSGITLKTSSLNIIVAQNDVPK